MLHYQLKSLDNHQQQVPDCFVEEHVAFDTKRAQIGNLLLLLQLLVQLLLAAFATLTVSQVIGVLESYINAWISQRIIFDMKNQMYDHLQHMPHAFFTGEKQGDIITRMNTDISGVSTVISNTLSSIVSNIATVVTTLVALFSMSWELAIVGMLVIPLLIIPSRKVGNTRFKLLTESQAKSDELNQIINEEKGFDAATITEEDVATYGLGE